MKEFKNVDCPICKTTFTVRFPPKFEVAAKHECAIQFWEGFDACLELVLNSLDNQDSNEIAKFTVWDFIEDFKQHLSEEAELYKKDG